MSVAPSVKQKIVLSLWSVTFLLLVLAGGLAATWFTLDQAKRLDDFLSRESRSVKEVLETYFTYNGGEDVAIDGEEFRTFLDGYLTERLNRPLPYKTTLGVFDLRGQLIKASNSAIPLDSAELITLVDLQLSTVEDLTPHRLAIIPFQHRGKILGTVRLTCLTVTLDEVWKSFLFSLVMVMVLVFLSFGFLGTLLIRWSLKPVREMSFSARDISETHLDLRLTVPPGKDELAELAQTLNRLLDRLEKDFEFEETLVGQLSHELRTPLAILRGRNETALERMSASPKDIELVLEENLADIDNIVSLLNTLLKLARFDGRIDVGHRELCDLSLVLRDLIEELEPLWEEKTLSFHLSLPGRISNWSRCLPVMVHGDPVLLRQIFLNILTNAFKYTPPGKSIHLAIEKVGSTDTPFWSLVIGNPGPPIPEESLELVFKRFYRVEVQDPDRFERESGMLEKGFGLGLSIAKTLVEMHGGQIRAFNPDQGGAAFEVLLPYVANPSGPLSTKKRSES